MKPMWEPAPAVILVLTLVFAGCGSAQPSGPPASPEKPRGSAAATTMDQLYEAAKKEGEVVVNNQDPESEKPSVDAFTKRYPGIKVTYQVGRGTDISRKLVTQAQGNIYTHDVFSAGPHDTKVMRDANLFEPYQSPELANVRQEFYDKDKISNPVYVLVYGYAVNIKLVPAGQEPKSYKDLLDTRWKGKMAMQDPRGSGGAMTTLIGVSKEQTLGLDYIRKLGQQDVFLGRETQQLLTDLIRGEHAVLLAPSAGNLVTQREKNAAAPFKQIKPTEGLALTLLWISLVKNAPHPNAARLWLNWRMSQEGQEMLGKQGQAPVRNGVKTPHEETTIEGSKIMYLDVGQDNDSVPEYTKLWDDIFFAKK